MALQLADADKIVFRTRVRSRPAQEPTLTQECPCVLLRKSKTKMYKQNQHVVPHEGGWAVGGAGSQRARAVHDTQAAAIDQARSISRHQGTELLIHGTDGRLRDRDSHGHDPYPHKD